MAQGSYKYYEFDLVVRKKGYEEGPVDPYNFNQQEKEPKIKVLEELKFNTLDAKEVMRKLIDYLE